MLGISSEESLESGWGELRHLTSPQRNQSEGTAWRFGVESNSPMSQILSTLNRRKLFLHRKKTCRSFFREDEGAWCHSPSQTNLPQTPKKNAKNGSLRWLPLLVPQSRCDFRHFRHGSVSQIGREMFQSEKKTMSIFDKSLFNGWITPKDKTKSQQFRFYLLMPSPTDFGSFTFPDVHHFSNNLSHKNGIVYSC